MTLHDQLAVAEAARPGEFFNKKETLPLVVDDKGYTVVNKFQAKALSCVWNPSAMHSWTTTCPF